MASKDGHPIVLSAGVTDTQIQSLSCPQCSSSKGVIESTPSVECRVICPQCGFTPGWRLTKKEAVEEWCRFIAPDWWSEEQQKLKALIVTVVTTLESAEKAFQELKTAESCVNSALDVALDLQLKLG